MTYAYDSLGELTSEGDNFSSDSYQYDLLGRQTAAASANPGQPTVVLSSGYDAAGSKAVGDDLRTSLSANIGGTLDAGGTVSGGTRLPQHLRLRQRRQFEPHRASRGRRAATA